MRRGNPGRAQWLLRRGDRADGLRRQGGWGPLGRIPERGERHGAISETCRGPSVPWGWGWNHLRGLEGTGAKLRQVQGELLFPQPEWKTPSFLGRWVGYSEGFAFATGLAQPWAKMSFQSCLVKLKSKTQGDHTLSK